MASTAFERYRLNDLEQDAEGAAIAGPPATQVEAANDAGTRAAGMGRRLVTEYRPLLRYARRLTSNSAATADLVHTVFAKVLEKRVDLAMPDNLQAWLRAVLLRTFIDERRRAVRESLAEESMLDQQARSNGHASSPEPPSPGFSVTIEEARAVIAALPNYYREPYELYTFQHLSYDEIASRLKLSTKTVGSRLNRARKRLRALLTAERVKRHRPRQPPRKVSSGAR